jgi:hypothetical protein
MKLVMFATLAFCATVLEYGIVRMAATSRGFVMVIPARLNDPTTGVVTVQVKLQTTMHIANKFKLAFIFVDSFLS